MSPKLAYSPAELPEGAGPVALDSGDGDFCSRSRSGALGGGGRLGRWLRLPPEFFTVTRRDPAAGEAVDPAASLLPGRLLTRGGGGGLPRPPALIKSSFLQILPAD